VKPPLPGIDPERPADAVADYYARFCPEAEVRRLDEPGIWGLVTLAWSGFGPVAVMRASSDAALPWLVEQLPPERCYVMAPLALRPGLEACVSFDEPDVNCSFWSDGGLADKGTDFGEVVCAPDLARLRLAGVDLARCHVLWRSPRFAELAVQTEVRFRRQGLGSACVRALSLRLLDEGTIPLLVASQGNPASLALARKLGFHCCQQQEFAGYVEPVTGAANSP